MSVTGWERASAHGAPLRWSDLRYESPSKRADKGADSFDRLADRVRSIQAQARGATRLHDVHHRPLDAQGALAQVDDARLAEVLVGGGELRPRQSPSSDGLWCVKQKMKARLGAISWNCSGSLSGRVSSSVVKLWKMPRCRRTAHPTFVWHISASRFTTASRNRSARSLALTGIPWSETLPSWASSRCSCTGARGAAQPARMRSVKPVSQ